MARRSYLDEINPNRPRQRTIRWPLGGEARVVVRILSDSDREAAYFATRDYFESLPKVKGEDGKVHRRKVDVTDPAFVNRERSELVWRAFRSPDGEPLTVDADALSGEPSEVISSLWSAWADFQGQVGAKPVDQALVNHLVDDLKKNIPAEALHGLPSNWLIAVISTLAGQSSSSPTTSESG